MWFDSCMTQKAWKLVSLWRLNSVRPPILHLNKLSKLGVQSEGGVASRLSLQDEEAFTSSPQSYQHLNHKARHRAGNAELGVSWGWGQNQLRLSSHFCLPAFLKGALPIEKGAQSETLLAMNSAHVFLLEPVKMAPRLKHPNSLSGSSTLACIWAHFSGMKEDERKL